MKTLQGFRTLIFNIIAVIASWLAQNFDLPISVEHQVAIGTTVIAIGNITLRFFTKTPIGNTTAPHPVYTQSHDTPDPKLAHIPTAPTSANNDAKPNNQNGEKK